ncbi:MAG: hypothetical protein KDD61_11955, partial [Bdellovibrionales bacterium]|nr:hypothetical protein [Bdellovibrionales bacterium]
MSASTYSFRVMAFFFLLVFPLLSQGELSCPNSKDVSVKWAGGEHIDLADRGFAKACDSTNSDSIIFCKNRKIERHDGRMKMTYGQISALGDFYENPFDIYFEEGEEGFTVDNIKRVFRCMDKEGQVFKEQKQRPNVELPNCEWVYFINNPEYLKLVLGNVSHFAWHNMKAYVRLHTTALEYALLGRTRYKNNDLKKADEYLRMALYINGFADHFLTDAFPAGHVRVPRDHIKSWVKKNLNGILREIRGDILSLILHNTEGKNTSMQEVGLNVKNSLGHQWATYSDGKLHHCRSNDHPGIWLPTEAVRQSVREVFEAYSLGIVPEGIFSATLFVPFPNENAMEKKYSLYAEEMGYTKLTNFLVSAIPKPL